MRRYVILGLLVIIILQFLILPSSSNIFPMNMKLTGGSTNVYGLNYIELPGNLKYYSLISTRDYAIIAGEGYIAKVNINTESIERALGVIGNVTSLSVDSNPPEWVTVGTSLGEVIVASFKDLTPKTSFYVASRGSVKSAYLARVGGEERLIVLDNMGFLYVMKFIRGVLSSGGWFEVGPVRHRGALIGLYDVNILRVYPTIYFKDWVAYFNSGEKIVAFTNVILPATPIVNSFLGGLRVQVYYNISGLLEPSYTGLYRVNENITIERRLYYGVVYESILLPLSLGRDINVYEASNYTITILGLPPQKYTILSLYEVRVVDTVKRIIIKSSYYAGYKSFEVKPGLVTDMGSLELNYCGSTLSSCLEGTIVNGIPFNKLDNPAYAQVLLLIDTSRLPEIYEYGVDIKTIIAPISREMADRGILNLANHQVAMLLRPKLGIPTGWADKGIKSILAIGIGEWLLIYYLGEGLSLVDVGYTQPQIIYLGSRITALEVSPDSRRIYVGVSNGTVYKLSWLMDLPLITPHIPNKARYYMSLSLVVDSTPIASIVEIYGGKLTLATSMSGRIQLINLEENIWHPLWRSAPGFLGLDTRLGSIIAGSRYSDKVILYSPGSNKIYLFNQPLKDLNPVFIRVLMIDYTLEGSWLLIDPIGDISVKIKENNAIVAETRVSNSTATLYLPQGLFNLTINFEGRESRSILFPVTIGFNEALLVLIPQPRSLLVELIRELNELNTIARLYTPRVNVEFKIRDVDGNPILSPVRITLISEHVTYRSTSSNGLVLFSDVPLGIYKLEALPLDRSYESLSINVKVTMRGVEPSILILKPRSINVTIKLIDGTFNTLVQEPFKLKIERLEPGSHMLDYPREFTVTKGSYKTSLPPGTYKVTLTLAGRDIYEVPRDLKFIVEASGEVIIKLKPKVYNVVLEVRDTWSKPVADAIIKVIRVEGGLEYETTTSENGLTSLSLPHGTYDITIEKRWYKKTYKSITVPETLEDKIVVEPTLPLLTLKYSPYLLVAGGALVAIIALIRIKRIVEEKLREEYF
ncbi:MAG: carboxypeptidase-like regulatory domain-containing protein [Acidilobaceae archaeon]